MHRFAEKTDSAKTIRLVVVFVDNTKILMSWNVPYETRYEVHRAKKKNLDAIPNSTYSTGTAAGHGITLILT